MSRYLTPTSEFWTWSRDRVPIDEGTSLTIQLIGLGWIVRLTSTADCDLRYVIAEEQRLIGLMDKLFSDLELSAILRLKSGHWTKADLNGVVAALKAAGVACRRKQSTIVFPTFQAQVHCGGQGESLDMNGISRDRCEQVEHALDKIKAFANRESQGARWCAYERRRLTLIIKRGGDEDLAPEDIEFLRLKPSEPLLPRIAEIQRRGVGALGILAFAAREYHLGVVHPRAVFVQHYDTETEQFIGYVMYLWNTHYRRIWLYLHFEDQYAYVDRVTSARRYDATEIAHYWNTTLALDDLASELATQETLDRGGYQSYRPPHSTYREIARTRAPNANPPGAMGPVTPLAWLRRFLIQGTVSALQGDPLAGAGELLSQKSEAMRSTLDLFTDTLNLRMQRALETLQVFFIIGAVAVVVQLGSLGTAFGPAAAAWARRQEWLEPLRQVVNRLLPGQGLTLVAAALNFVIVLVVSVLALLTLRRPSVSRLLSRLIARSDEEGL